MSAKHIDGPWNYTRCYRVDPDYGRTPLIVPENGENPVAEITNDYTDEAMWANARLIAAAPELLTELIHANVQLEMIADCLENGRIEEARLHANAMRRVRQNLIAKATGAE